MAELSASALQSLEQSLQAVRFELPSPALSGAAQAHASALSRLRQHILPRLADLDAPLLAVLGGSTGAGKSTVVNTLLGREVSAASVLRPTTRRPLLLHSPADRPWFASGRVLSDFSRLQAPDQAAPSSQTEAGGKPTLEVRAAPELPPGVAVIDAPDFDSLDAGNRKLAAALLEVADLWIFLTTAARYADALPWEFLAQAAARQVAVAVILNRVPPGAGPEISADLRARLTQAGLGSAPLFVIEERQLEAGLLPAPAFADFSRWFAHLGADAQQRAEIARTTLAGSVLALDDLGRQVVDGARYQAEICRRARQGIANAQAQILTDLSALMSDGSVLRGEVLARWQEIVGVTNLWKGAGRWVARIRDRLEEGLHGEARGEEQVEPVRRALSGAVGQLLISGVENMADHIQLQWRTDPDLAPLAAASAPWEAADLPERVTTLVHEWQSEVLEMIRQEGGAKLRQARYLAAGINLVGVALMLVIFSSTAGLTGAELGVSGATAVVAQKLLELVFGDQSVRKMAARGKARLEEMTQQLVGEYAAFFTEQLPEVAGEEQIARLEEDLAACYAQWSGRVPTATVPESTAAAQKGTATAQSPATSPVFSAGEEPADDLA